MVLVNIVAKNLVGTWIHLRAGMRNRVEGSTGNDTKRNTSARVSTSKCFNM